MFTRFMISWMASFSASATIMLWWDMATGYHFEARDAAALSVGAFVSSAVAGLFRKEG